MSPPCRSGTTTRTTWPGLLGRRFRYGTSAAPLARRHPGQLAPLVLHPWPAAVVAAALARRPVLTAAAAAGSWLSLTRAVRAAGLPADGVTAAAATSVRQTWLGIGRYATQFAGPALALALAAPGGKTGGVRWGRRAAAASLLLGPALDAWRNRAPTLDPIRFTAGCVADDIAYGAGVWAGCARSRTLTPLLPKVAWRPLRVTRERNTADGQHLVRDRGGRAAARAQAAAAVGLRRARRRARSAGSRSSDNVAAFGELGFAPHVAGPPRSATCRPR